MEKGEHVRVTTLRAIGVAAAGLVLAGASTWAYAAPASGTDRSGTWIALAVAAVVAVAAGVAVLVGPSRQPRLGTPQSPDDTGEIQAWAEETHARRASLGRGGPRRGR
ncbi:hypothetical protein [Raineyella fluvialis]|uniref:Uncharacterized protein n=1 Tax=Raineyella fluvialis TaxID=2662261 RepID=A0A5Q2FBB5_9ACTN|nr:hypothetical protein [Raineyella fluvialis]QGF24018.1 hypothetical protein Rai3103_10365 [Raineyella fluvialis]